MDIIFIWARECPSCRMRRNAKNNQFSSLKKLPCLSRLSSPTFSSSLSLFQISADFKVRKIAPITNGKPTLKNVSYFADFEKKALDFKLKITEFPLPFINPQRSLESVIAALSIYIPYPILMKWHELVGIKDDRGSELDYVDLLSFWIPGQWFKLSKQDRSSIQGRLRREAGSVVKKFSGKKVGR